MCRAPPEPEENRTLTANQGARTSRKTPKALGLKARAHRVGGAEAQEQETPDLTGELGVDIGGMMADTGSQSLGTEALSTSLCGQEPGWRMHTVKI